MKRFVVFIVILNVSALLAFPEEVRFGINDRTGQFIETNISLRNDLSEEVILSSIIDKPTILNFVYYRCPGLCTPMLEGIAEAINYTESQLGIDYQVITISIDHHENSSLARQKKINYLKLLNKSFPENAWMFFTTDSLSIKKLTESAGWQFKRQGNEFVHPAATVLLTPNGKISQYFYGTYFNYLHLKMSINDARNEKTNPARLKRMKYCYNYEPPKNMYTDKITKTFGILVIIIAVFLFLFLAVVPHLKNRPGGISN